MGNLFANIMVSFWVGGSFVWLVQIWHRSGNFTQVERIRAVSFVLSFFLGLIWASLSGNHSGAWLCLTGFIVSQFALAVTFYDDFKEVEIPHE